MSEETPITGETRVETDSMGEIRVPATVIVGRHDVVTPPDVSQAMAAAIPGAHLVEVPAAGHLTPMENPAAVNEALGVLMRSV